MKQPSAITIEHNLDAFAQSRGFSAGQPHYIRGEFHLTTPDGSSLYSDEAHLWCEPCAEALLARALPLIPADEHDDYEVEEADTSKGQDTPAHCMACGVTLDHILSDYGIESELAHYEDHPIVDISPAEAFRLARMIESAPDREDVAKVGKDALKAITRGTVRKLNTSQGEEK